MELVVVVSASEKQEAIAQSRSHGLTGTDIYIYIHIYICIYIQTRSDNAAGLLASLYSSATISNSCTIGMHINNTALMLC